MKKIVLITSFVLILILSSFTQDASAQTQESDFQIPENTITLKPGQQLSIPIYANSNKNTTNYGFSFKPAYVADIFFSVNSKNIIKWNCKMRPGHTFRALHGTITVTDITSGFSHGRNPIDTQSGSLSIGRRHGHEYFAHINGIVLSNKDLGMNIPGTHLRWKAS